MFELFPRGLRARMKEDRAKKLDEKQRVALAAATSELVAFDKANPKPATEELKKQRAEHELRVSYLKVCTVGWKEKSLFSSMFMFHLAVCFGVYKSCIRVE